MVRLTPKQALALSIALHELATNAAKYGALSTDAGHVKLTWDVRPEGAGEMLHLAWCEAGGPKVSPPARAGFGSRLIERNLAFELNGAARIEYRPEGVAHHRGQAVPELRSRRRRRLREKSFEGGRLAKILAAGPADAGDRESAGTLAVRRGGDILRVFRVFASRRISALAARRGRRAGRARDRRDCGRRARTSIGS